MPTSYVTVSLCGGLGNQLFQICTALAYGKTNKRRCIFPEKLPIGGCTERPTYWDTFLEPLKEYTTINPSNGFTQSQLVTFSKYMEPCHNYYELPVFPSELNVCLSGYFQSYRYFGMYKSSILETLNIRSHQMNIESRYPILQTSPDTHLVAMHFRLGDYVALQHAHIILPVTYYKNALKIINARITDKKIIVIVFCESSDMNNVLKSVVELKKEYPHIEFKFIDKIGNLCDWEQMIAISCCNSCVIANSTFSWWGAYFSPFTASNVYYPSTWFGPALANKNVNDMFPTSWTKVQI